VVEKQVKLFGEAKCFVLFDTNNCRAGNTAVDK
jgi:hypothetical protein